MSVCILAKRHPTDPDMDILVDNPNGTIPYWTGDKGFVKAYEAAKGLNASNAVAVQFVSEEHLRSHIGSYANLLEKVSVN